MYYYGIYYNNIYIYIYIYIYIRIQDRVIFIDDTLLDNYM